MRVLLQKREYVSRVSAGTAEEADCTSVTPVSGRFPTSAKRDTSSVVVGASSPKDPRRGVSKQARLLMIIKHMCTPT